ncbi:MAG: hypothetical protein BGO19_01710 [Acinetobacter sp. 38-8]|nr:MAG: hypothetical protein BGO19_01710 [Acinetobacter sp. 38-8]
MRHGQTDFNKENKWMGLLDIPLNVDGISQAQSSISSIKSLNIDVIYCSELKRAIQTSRIIANKLNLPILIDKRLNERSLGSLEGIIKNPSLLESCFSLESESNISERMRSFFKDLPKNKNVLLISHSALFKIILKNKLIVTDVQIIKNAQVTAITIYDLT